MIEDKEALKLAEYVLLRELGKYIKEDEQFLIQPWHDGWLIHVYVNKGTDRIATVGGASLSDTLQKLDERLNEVANGKK